MPAPASATDFIDIVQKSGLVDAARWQSYVAVRQTALPEAPSDLAALLVQDGLLTRFQAQQLLKGRYRNFTIGRYRILEPLGAGGMSKVFLCEHATMKHRVALKLLPLQSASDPAAVERFYREAQAVAALNHPNIVRAHDIDREGDKYYYMIMDYVDGTNLHELVKRIGPLSAERAAHYTAQAALGLQHIFEAGLIHRDLKPSNLLLDRTGTIKILDLGLARFRERSGEGITEKYDENAILGTADYLSPEQALRSTEVDVRSDIYSLGATVYYLLTGRPPFLAENVTQKLLAHQMHEPDPIGQQRPDVPAAFVAVVRKMMAKNARDRYQQPYEIVEALTPWTALPIDLPAEAEMPTRVGVGPHSSTSTTRVARPPSSGKLLAPSARPMSGGTSGVHRHPAVDPSGATPAPGHTLSMNQFAAGRAARRGPMTAAAALAAVVVVGGGCWYAWQQMTAPDVPPASQKGTPPAVASQTPIPENVPAGSLVVGSGPGGFASVSEAANAATPGSRILVVGDLSERLQLRNPPADLVIESWPPNKRPVWRAPVNLPADQPMIDLFAAKGLKLRGFIVEGGGRAVTLVQIRGSSPGLTLEELQLRDFTRTAIKLVGASGQAGQPITLRKSRISTARDVAAGVEFDPGVDGAVCRYFSALDNRFEGPLGAAFYFAGSAGDIDVSRNRFFGNAEALRYCRADPPTALRISMAGNTFCELQRGLVFDAVPPSETSLITLTDNLFSSVGRLAQLDRAVWKVDNPAAQWIWIDEGAPGEVPGEGVRYFRQTFDLTEVPKKAVLDIGANDTFEVFVNGQSVGRGPRPYFTKKVYAFDVSALLKPGTNVVAVKATNQLDPMNKFYRTAAAVLCQLSDPTTKAVFAATDANWKASDTAPADWTSADFDAGHWSGVRVLPAGGNMPWQDAAWESVTNLAYPPGKAVPLNLRGNVRDYKSNEYFPLLDTIRGFVKPLPTKAGDDATFLRYDKDSPLIRAGTDQGPVGVPPE